MFLRELFENTRPLTEEATIVWARVGNKVVKKYRCMCGTKQGQLVSSPNDCQESMGEKKRFKLRTGAIRG